MGLVNKCSKEHLSLAEAGLQRHVTDRQCDGQIGDGETTSVSAYLCKQLKK